MKRGLRSRLAQYGDEDFAFFRKTLQGQQEPQARWKICSNAANDGNSGFQRRYTRMFGGISRTK